MINISLAILFSTFIMVLFKLFDRFKVDIVQAITINYLIAVILGVVTYTGELSATDVISLPWIYHGMVIGCFFILVFFVFANSAQKVGIAITAVSSKMSVVIPIIVGILILKNDSLTLFKTVGIILALMAFYLTFKKDEKIDLKKRYFLLPVLLFLGNGTNDSLMSFTSFTYQVDGLNQTTLLLTVIFSTALILGIFISIYRRLAHGVTFQKRNIIPGILLGIFNFFSTYFFFVSLHLYTNSVFFPIFNAGIVSMSALVGYFVFREQLRRINWIGILMAIVAIVVIAFTK